VPAEAEKAALELSEPGPMRALLLETLVAGRVPAEGDTPGPALTEAGRELVLSVLATRGASEVRAFLEGVVSEPRDESSVAAALRLFGRTGRPGDVRAFGPLLAAFPPLDSARIEDALERAVVDWAAREPTVCAELPALCAELSDDAAGVVIRALGSAPSVEAVECLRQLLGRREALTTCVLQALAGAAAHVAPDDAPHDVDDLAGEIVPHLASDDVLRAVAAASTLGRLRSKRALPYLIEALDRDEDPVARAALTSLRAISGTQLAASASLWKRWCTREERWWRERAPELRSFVDGESATRSQRADLSAWLAELSEHPLYRDELAPLAARALAHGDPEVRILACRALERLCSRAALAQLSAALADEAPAVAAAAARALEHIAPPRSRAAEVTGRGAPAPR
jgi:hypothetical protein